MSSFPVTPVWLRLSVVLMPTAHGGHLPERTETLSRLGFYWGRPDGEGVALLIRWTIILITEA